MSPANPFPSISGPTTTTKIEDGQEYVSLVRRFPTRYRNFLDLQRHLGTYSKIIEILVDHYAVQETIQKLHDRGIGRNFANAGLIPLSLEKMKDAYPGQLNRYICQYWQDVRRLYPGEQKILEARSMQIPVHLLSQEQYDQEYPASTRAKDLEKHPGDNVAFYLPIGYVKWLKSQGSMIPVMVNLIRNQILLQEKEPSTDE